ncbi:MAG TPA: MarR family winged helix-turn-helix transcriptional regulator [Beijerinckiaceae bacterium]
MTAERLLDDLFPGEAAAARLRLLGLLVLIFAYEDDPDPPTVTRLAALAGLTQGTVRAHLKTLLAHGLVERTKHTRPGRGRALRLSVKETGAAGRLVEAMRGRARGPAGSSSPAHRC